MDAEKLAIVKEAGRYFASLRRRKQGPCAICGAPIEGTLKRLYCSNRCAVRAYKARHREEINRRQRERRQRAKEE